ncbi:hypothetical protein TRFO_28196 [Tritrichomonas foetus]|uniref:DNA damage-binding protein 1 n=1 Tax=Tritrichomonas foetus TaxID=1144522 RepID=A0A1J4K0M6_9EUKA|nr:hypothetical protein TRFO_28196 [Tritrichomonas foetus]|eukprot:OHT04312.1 hypothetical protein TRFO_28196 [Tritrichomonas foetus]
MTYFIHRTLRSSSNVLDVIPGNWYPKVEGPQFILNLHTAFELYRIIQSPNGIRFFRLYIQLFMSKVYCICPGPSINGVSSFFALRDNDIIQLSYSENEDLFVLRIRLTLPPLLVSSNFIFYSDPILIVSSSRGGICAFEFSQQESKLAFCEKTSEYVLSTFPFQYSGIVGRIEAGPTVAIYDKTPFSLRTKLSFPDEKVSCIFDLPNGIIAVCVPGKIIFINESTKERKETPIPIIYMADEIKERNDFIIQATCIDPENIYLLTSRGKVFVLQNFTLSFKLMESKFSRIFGLTEDFILFTMKGEDHRIYNIKKNMIISRIQSVVGTRGLFLGTQTHFLAPHTISHSGNMVVLGRQGLNVLTLSTFECAEPIYGTHSFSVNGKNYVVISFQNSSRILEVIGNELKQSESLSINETVQTLGMCPLVSNHNQTILFQINPDGISVHAPNASVSEFKISPQVTAYAANSKQLLIALANRQIRIFQINANSTGKNGLEPNQYEVQFVVNSLALSKPDSNTGIAEYVAYGATDSQSNNFSVKLQTISLDPSARSMIFSERMPSKVTSLKFIDELRLVIGLETGAVVVGTIDVIQRRLDNIATFQLGNGQCLLTPIPISRDAQLILALNSRPMLIQLQRQLPRFRPLAISSVGYAASLGEKGRFLLASGRKLSINTFSDTASETAVSRFTMDSEVVATCPIPNERFIFIALANSLQLFDASKGSQPQVLEHFPNETIRSINLGASQSYFLALCSTVNKNNSNHNNTETSSTSLNSMTTLSSMNAMGMNSMNNDGYQNMPCNLSVTGTIGDDSSRNNGFDNSYTSTVKLYEILFTQTSVQIKPPMIGHCKRFVDTICFATNCVIAGSGDTLLCFKPHDGILQITSQISGIGLNIRFLVYNPPTKMCKGSIYAGDSCRSVKMLRFSEKTKQFKLCCEEGCPRQITTLSTYEDRSVCGGDANGNVFIFDYPPIHLTADAVLDPTIFSAKRRITTRLNFFVGDTITGVQHTSDTFNCLWYSTVSGSLGGFISPQPNAQKDWSNDFNRRIKLLKAVEVEVSRTYMQICGCDHVSFRNRLYPAANVIDMDMIEVYTKLCEERKRKIAQKIAEIVKAKPIMKVYDSLTPADIEFEINKFRNYFINWQSKR